MGFNDDASVHNAAAGIFDLLPDDPFGEGEGEELGGQEEEGLSPAGDESEDEDLDPDFDAEAADALREQGEETPSGDEDDDDGEDEGSEDESEDDDEQEDEQEDEKVSTFTVKVDGKEEEVPLDELLAGYSRTASWTQKSQALADERRAFEAEAKRVQDERAELAYRLKETEVAMQANLPKEPSSDDPRAWIQYKQEMDRLSAVQQERLALEQAMIADANAEHDRAVMAEQAKLPEMIPGWKEPEAMKKGLKSLSTFAVGLGFTDEELASADSRAVKLLWMAQQYEGLDEAKKGIKAKTKRSTTLKPGKPRRRSSKAKKTSGTQRDRLRQTGNVKDAAQIIHDSFLDD